MTTAIILAGGLGTRLRGVVDNVPKPMAPINNKPFLEFIMDYWITQGVKHFHLSVGYMHEKIISHFKDNYKNIPITYTIEKTPVGTGGGLKLCLNSLPKCDNFLLLNGDTFFGASLEKIIKFHNKYESSLTMCLFKFDEPNRFGEIILDNSKNVLCIKSNSYSNSGYANSGVYFFNSTSLKKIFEKFNQNKLSLEDDIISAFIRNKSVVKAIKFNKPFIDIGLPKDYALADSFFNTYG